MMPSPIYEYRVVSEYSIFQPWVEPQPSFEDAVEIHDKRVATGYESRIERRQVTEWETREIVR